MKKIISIIVLLVFITVLFSVNVYSEDDTYPINYRITATTLNVRLGPGTEYDIFYVLTRGEEVKGKEVDSDWVEVNCYGYKGFVYKNYICDASKSTSGYSTNGNMTYLGCYSITGYAPYCGHCCHKKYPDGITASGEKAVVGQTVAMAGLPFGSYIYIEGLGTYRVNDRGVGSGVVDVACSNHSECYALTSRRNVYLVQ